MIKMNQKMMLIIGVVVVIIGLFAWPAISPETSPQILDDITTTIVGDHEYVTLGFSVDTWYSVTGQQMYADIDFNGARWTDKKGWDAAWFTTAQDVVAYIDVQYNEKTYSYAENFGKVSTYSKETHSFDIVSDITDEIYGDGGAGPIYWDITMKEGSDILAHGQQSGSFTMG